MSLLGRMGITSLRKIDDRVRCALALQERLMISQRARVGLAAAGQGWPPPSAATASAARSVLDGREERDTNKRAEPFVLGNADLAKTSRVAAAARVETMRAIFAATATMSAHKQRTNSTSAKSQRRPRAVVSKDDAACSEAAWANCRVS